MTVGIGFGVAGGIPDYYRTCTGIITSKRPQVIPCPSHHGSHIIFSAFDVPHLDRFLERLPTPPAGEVERRTPAPLVEQSRKLVVGVHQLGVAPFSLLDAEFAV